MSQPPAYNPQHAFVADSATLANFPGQALDVEFQSVKATTDAIETNLALIQRDDGALANSVVGYDQLSLSLQTNALAPAAPWATATTYAADRLVITNSSLYRALIAHTSGVFATDLAAGKWALVGVLPTSPPTTDASQLTSGILPAARLPNPAPTTLGGVKSLASAASKWLKSIGTDGTPTQTQPAFSDLSGNIALSQMNSGTGANSSTYWRGDGSWATLVGGQVYDTRAAVAAATIPAIVNQVQTAGYLAVGDGGGSIATNAAYKRVGSLPAHSGYIQSADGAYWELTGSRVSVRQFGAVPVVSNLDTDPDAAAAINLCMAYCNLKQSNMLIPAGQWPLDSAITSPTFIIEINGAQGGGQPTVLYKRYVEADANKGIISLGAWGATITDIQVAAKAGTSGGSGLSAILPNNAANIGILRIRNFYVSCGDGINADLHINGIANTGGGGGLGGKSYRSVFLENCHFFGAAQYGVVLLSVQHCFATNCFLDVSGGTVSSGVLFNCAGNVTSINDDIYWNGIISGALSLDYTTRAVFHSIVTGSITNTANVDDVTVQDCRGTVGTSWTNSGVVNVSSWISTTPTPTASSGSFTTVSCALRHRVFGKTVFFSATITITTAGTAAGNIVVPLPFTPVGTQAGGGKETASTGLQCNWQTTASTLVIAKYDNTTIIANGRTVIVSGTLELA